MGSARTAVFLGLLSAAVCLTGSAAIANAFDVSRTVRLPDGTSINLGPYAQVVERAVDQGRLAVLAEGYLIQDLTADAAAVLVYAARHRPGETSEIADIAVSLASEYEDPGAVALIFSALAAEPVMLREVLVEALETAGLAENVRAAAYFAIGLPEPEREEETVRAEDVSADTDGQSPQTRTAGDVFGGSLLPETLRIGGGQGGAVDGGEPGADGGAS